MVVGCGLPCQSGIVLGTSITRPSTLILILSTGGGGAGAAGLFSVGAAVDIANSVYRPAWESGLAAIFMSWVGPAPCVRDSSAAPLASKSSLNFVTKLNTGQAQASPK